MEESTTKEKTLKKVRNALIHKTDNPFPKIDLESPVFNDPDENTDISFATAFTKTGGKFIYCQNEKEAMTGIVSLIGQNNWNEIFAFDKEIQAFLNAADVNYVSEARQISKAKVGITFCEFLIARFGSVVISSAQKSGRRLPVFPEVHIVLAFSSQIVAGIKDAMAGIKTRYGRKIPSEISMITGPSRTADIEKTLVMGAHGPREIYVFLIDDSIN